MDEIVIARSEPAEEEEIGDEGTGVAALAESKGERLIGEALGHGPSGHERLGCLRVGRVAPPSGRQMGRPSPNRVGVSARRAGELGQHRRTLGLGRVRGGCTRPTSRCGRGP